MSDSIGTDFSSLEREVGPDGETYVIYYAFLDNLPDSYKVTLGGNVINLFD